MSHQEILTTPKGNKIFLVKEDYQEPYRRSAVDIMTDELDYPKDNDPKWSAKFTKYMAKSNETKLYWQLALLINGGNETRAEELLINKRELFFEKEIIKMYMSAKERSQGATNISKLVEEENLFFYRIARFRTNGDEIKAKKLMNNPMTFFRHDPIINEYCRIQKAFKNANYK